MQAQAKLPTPAFQDIAPGAPLSMRADKATPYQPLAEVMADATREGMRRIGFISDPRDAN